MSLSKSDALIKAVSENNIKEAQALIVDEANIYSTDNLGDSTLLIALRNKNVELVSILLAAHMLKEKILDIKYKSDWEKVYTNFNLNNRYIKVESFDKYKEIKEKIDDYKDLSVPPSKLNIQYTLEKNLQENFLISVDDYLKFIKVNHGIKKFDSLVNDQAADLIRLQICKNNPNTSSISSAKGPSNTKKGNTATVIFTSIITLLGLYLAVRYSNAAFSFPSCVKKRFINHSGNLKFTCGLRSYFDEMKKTSFLVKKI
ncbi:MAG: ankyrin repeat domain-containing protein [Sphingobacteriia bacterium]|nr:ankyrin repeat domain-containing protein [Sphingobacteriia bacterium]